MVGGAVVAPAPLPETRASSDSSGDVAVDSSESGDGLVERSEAAAYDDGDTVPTDIDNCPFVRHRDQIDSDGNG